MTGNHLFDALAGSAAAAEKVFLDRPGEAPITYGAFFARTGQVANALIARGLAPGDRVAAQVGKSAEALALYLATVRAGGAFLPLNPAYTDAEIDYFLGDAAPRVFVTEPSRDPTARAIAARHGIAHVETLDEAGQGSLAALADAQPADHQPAVRGPADLASILYTSGTTGRAKGAMLSHGNLAANAAALVAAWRFTAEDVLLHALPIFHIHGLYVATNVALLSRAMMLYLPRFDADAVTAAMAKATVMMGVPTYYARLLARGDFGAEQARNMRLFISGSAPLSAELHREFAARTGHAILERYGMTETGMNTSNPYDGERRPGTVGFPLPGVELRVTDRGDGRVLPRGEIGMIEVRGPNVFSGYWRLPERKADDFHDGYFVTGDVGLIDGAGYVSIVGRDKDLIITGGLNVYPAEVEACIDEIDGVGECAVIGVPHPDYGEGVVAVVAPRNGARLSEAAITAPLARRLAGFKQPKRVVFVAALPRNAMGKIEKARLRADYGALFGA